MGTPADNTRYRPVDLRNVAKMPHWERVDADLRAAIRVVGEVLPFRTNRYVMDELIDWSSVPDDPLFQLVFPQREMLADSDFEAVEGVLADGDPEALAAEVERIRRSLNPHPGGAAHAQRPAARRAAVAGAAAQVPRDGPVLSRPGPDLPRLLHLLLPVGAVRGHGGSEVPGPGDGRSRRLPARQS